MSLSKIKELEPKKDKPVSITGLEKILHVTFELQEQTLSCSVVSRILNMESKLKRCLLYTSPSPRDLSTSRMPSSA